MKYVKLLEEYLQTINEEVSSKKITIKEITFIISEPEVGKLSFKTNDEKDSELLKKFGSDRIVDQIQFEINRKLGKGSYYFEPGKILTNEFIFKKPSGADVELMTSN